MLSTRFTELVGCAVPIQVAPMGAITGPELVAAASNAGAFAVIGTATMSAEQIEGVLDKVAELTSAPVGANVLMPFLDESVVSAIAPRVKVVDFYYATPRAALIQIAHDTGALACWQVGTVDEAKAAVDAGCDLLAARGVEGGGRMHGDQPLWPLLNGVLDAMDVPVLAAGGLATARDLAAVLAFGADGVRMGTRFVATAESGAHPIYKQAIVDAKADETALVDDFSVLWPNGPEPHRVLKCSLEAARALEGEFVGEMIFMGEPRPMPKFAIPPPVADSTGNIEAFAMYAGTSVGAIDSIEPAARVIERIASGAEALLSARANA